MNVLGLTITRRHKAAVAPTTVPTSYTSLGGWFPIVREAFAGAWQKNVEYSQSTVLSFAAVYACVTLIASDIGKLRIKLVAKNADGIWEEVESSAFSPVLRKPNWYQNRIKFLEQWLISKLISGNTYVLKHRDERKVVVGLTVLDPSRCRPMVAPNGAVYYALGEDNLANVDQADAVVPASEIIHDVMVPLYHPLCGVSPIFACGMAAMQGLRVQQHSFKFFANGAVPGGVLTAPHVLDDQQQASIQKQWMDGFSGENYGRVAVLSGGFKYEAMGIKAVDAQLIEQLKWTGENVCTAFHVPAYMIGIGPTPAYNNIEALNQQYYSQCLQNLIESIELLLDEGLGLDKASTSDGRPYGTELELDDLLRMDTAARVKAAADAVGSGTVSPNEARFRWMDLGPVKGGQTPYLQQQNYSLAALDERDRNDPFSKQEPPTLPTPDGDDNDDDDMARALVAWRMKCVERGLSAVSR